MAFALSTYIKDKKALKTLKLQIFLTFFKVFLKFI